MMPPTLSRIFGWAPPSSEDFLDVDVPEQPLLNQLPAFHMCDNDAVEPSSPTSSTSALSDGHLERRVDVPSKKGNPTWVARPRNEFILFRCDYVRRHTKEGGNKRNRRAPGQEAEKTLSKLAAEAWRALSSEERVYWREQANLERTDHARKYPDYRYRPKKSATARKRQSRSSMSASVVTKPTPAPALLDRVTVDAVSRSPSYEPPMTLIGRRGTYLDNSSLRKSTSVPLLPSTGGRRDNWLPLSLQPIQNSFESRTNSTGLDTYQHAIHPSLQHSQSYDSLGLATPALSESMSIPDSTSSSLMNWNGELPILSPQPTQYIDPLSIPIHSNFPSDQMHLSHKYVDAVSGNHPTLRRTNNIPQQFQQSVSDAHWAPGAYRASIGGTLMRTSSEHGLREQFTSPDSVYDTIGRTHHQMMEEYQHMNTSGIEMQAVAGVVPYLTSSAEMTPDEVFMMDREEYFPAF